MVANTSKQQYERTYALLCKRAGSEKLSDILKVIEDSEAKTATRLMYLNTIIALKKHQAIDGNVEPFFKLRLKLQDQAEKAKIQSNITDAQKESFDALTLDELSKFVAELKEQKDKNFKALETYLLLAIMIFKPLRNDLQEIRIVRRIAETKREGNVVYVPRSGPCKMILKDYKTSKTYGPISYELPIDVSDAIRQIATPNREFLFQTREGAPLTSSNLTHRLQNIIKKKFGVRAGSTILRKIFVTDKYRDVVKEMKEDAAVMGHSTQMQQETYMDNRKEGGSKLRITFKKVQD